MPIVDMPLEELERYPGTNPRPHDFDAYWDAALQELAGTDPKPELVRSTFQVPFADCFHLYFTGTGGSRVHAKYLRPKKLPKPHPAVLQFHGYSSHSGDWNDKLNFVAMGFSIAAMDCRGQAGLSEDIGGVKGSTFKGHIIRGLDDLPEKLMYRQLFLDTAQLARVVMDFPEVDPARMGATGKSQGGGLTLACGALVPEIKRLVPQCPFLCDYQRVWEMDLTVNAYEELRTYFRNYDPRHERRHEVFAKLGYVDCQHLAPRIKGHVLMSTGLMDEICPPSSQFAAYNKIKSQKEVIIYPDFAHENYPGFNDRAFKFLAGL